VFVSWGPTEALSDGHLLATTMVSLAVDLHARFSDLWAFQGWNDRSCGLVPAGADWDTATAGCIRSFMPKAVKLSLRFGKRRSAFSNGIQLRRILASQQGGASGAARHVHVYGGVHAALQVQASASFGGSGSRLWRTAPPAGGTCDGYTP
jgi:hypothetical protein